jgi:hypothetical protein
MKQYKCTTCNEKLDATENNFFPSNLKIATEKNKTSIPKCRRCAATYGAAHRKRVKDIGLTRNQQTSLSLAKAVRGTIYVIGPDIPGMPYKIGVTTGSCVAARKAALQTSHWLDLKLIWKSEVLERADKIESKIHKHFDDLRVRGEWFNITEDHIKEIPNLIKLYNGEQ